MTEDDQEQLALWLSVNHTRPNWEVIGMLAKGWPDATTVEIKQAWHRMQEIALENFTRQVEPLKRQPRFRVVDDEPEGGPSLR